MGAGLGGELTLIPSDEAIKTQIRVGDEMAVFSRVWREELFPSPPQSLKGKVNNKELLRLAVNMKGKN